MYRESSRIVGYFHGFWPGEVYQLENGTLWKQVGRQHTLKGRARPRATVRQVGDRYLLKVERERQEVEVVYAGQTTPCPKIPALPKSRKDYPAYLMRLFEIEAEMIRSKRTR